MNGHLETVAGGGARGSDWAGLGLLRAPRRLLEKGVVGGDELQALLAGAKLS